MAKQAKFQGKPDSDKDSKLGKTSSDDIKSAGVGQGKKFSKESGSKKGNKFRKNNKGDSFKKGTNDPS